MAKRGPRKKAAAAGREGINEQPPVEDQPDEALPTLGELAEAVASGEATPGGELAEEEIAKLQPRDVADLGELAVKPEDQADPGPAPPPEEVPRGTVGDPTDSLRQIVLGQLDPATPVAGAAISFDPRGGKWRDAIALRVAWVNDQGNVAVDLEWGDHNAVPGVAYGDGIRCWKFRGV